jgi:alkylhydroperoxidase family enzyme
VAWIKTVEPEAATGRVKAEYDVAMRRAGRIWNILRLMSPNPRVLKASMDFYLVVMHGSSPLSRGQRELLAVVVSRTNGCRY